MEEEIEFVRTRGARGMNSELQSGAADDRGEVLGFGDKGEGRASSA